MPDENLNLALRIVYIAVFFLGFSTLALVWKLTSKGNNKQTGVLKTALEILKKFQ